MTTWYETGFMPEPSAPTMIQAQGQISLSYLYDLAEGAMRAGRPLILVHPERGALAITTESVKLPWSADG
jgi:hypothetical protein